MVVDACLCQSGTYPINNGTANSSNNPSARTTKSVGHTVMPSPPYGNATQNGTHVSAILPTGQVTGVSKLTTVTDVAGNTIISGFAGATTLRPGLQDPTTVTLPGGTITYSPSPALDPGTTTLGNANRTVISNTDGLYTIPTGLTTPIPLTGSNGSVTTYTPPEPSPTTTINSANETVIIGGTDPVTIPTGITTPSPITLPDGHPTIFIPSSPTTTSTDMAGLLFPITSSVTAPGPGKTGSVIPCRMWFFDFCIKWGDINIGGWEFNLPKGPHPPGPPPPFPKLPGLHISLKGSPPPWPEFTIGPDRAPVFPPEPTEGTKCSTQTAEFCATTTTYGVSTSGTVTKTTSTSVLSTCGTITGCAVTGSTTTATKTSTCGAGASATGGSCPTAGTYPYVVYPKDGGDSKQKDQIADQLKSFLGEENESNLTSSSSKRLGVNYWTIPLNSTAPDDVRKIANVASVNAACDPKCTEGKCITCYDPTLGIQYQDPASPSLQFVSWPEGQSASLNNHYYFDDSNGKGTRVYVMDTGANLDSPEFKNTKLLSRGHNARFINIGVDFDGRTPQDDSYAHVDPNQRGYGAHGTAMLSLVAGNTLGVAKRAEVVIVRMPRRREFGGSFTPEDFLDGIQAISDDLADHPTTSDGVSAVVLLAHAYGRQEWVRKTPDGSWVRGDDGAYIYDDFGWMTRCKALLSLLSGVDRTLVIPGAGNTDAIVPMYPAAFARKTETQPLTDMLVVGAVENDGRTAVYRVDYPQYGIPHVVAPGKDVRVAVGDPYLFNNPDLDKRVQYRLSKGTSDASAITSGLAAYYLSLARSGQLPNGDGFENTPGGLKDYIIKQAWLRSQGTGDVPGIWNGVTRDMQEHACRWDPDAQLKRRRLGSRADSCPKPNPSSSDPSGGSGTGPASPSTTVDMKEQDTICEKKPSSTSGGSIDFARHVDFARRFCNESSKAASEYIYPPGSTSGSSGFQTTVHDGQGTNYTYTVQWVKGCATTADKLSVLNPGGPNVQRSCEGYMVSNLKFCSDNDDAGGSVQVGCAKYSFLGKAASSPTCEGCKSVSLDS